MQTPKRPYEAKCIASHGPASCTWMVRELGEAVSCTVLLDDDSLLVGGWDGTIKHWTEAGDLVWKRKRPIASHRWRSKMVQSMPSRIAHRCLQASTERFNGMLY